MRSRGETAGENNFLLHPEHGNWLNRSALQAGMPDIEINMGDRECLRKESEAKIIEATAQLWTKERNKEKRKINWTFTKLDPLKEAAKSLCTIINL